MQLVSVYDCGKGVAEDAFYPIVSPVFNVWRTAEPQNMMRFFYFSFFKATA
jgi:hypothetical protein